MIHPMLLAMWRARMLFYMVWNCVLMKRKTRFCTMLHWRSMVIDGASRHLWWNKDGIWCSTIGYIVQLQDRRNAFYYWYTLYRWRIVEIFFHYHLILKRQMLNYVWKWYSEDIFSLLRIFFSRSLSKKKL